VVSVGVTKEAMKLLRELGDLFAEIARRRIHPDCVPLYVYAERRGNDMATVVRVRCPEHEYELETSLFKLPEVTIREVA
jgi:hypothetical protein